MILSASKWCNDDVIIKIEAILWEVDLNPSYAPVLRTVINIIKDEALLTTWFFNAVRNIGNLSNVCCIVCIGVSTLLKNTPLSLSFPPPPPTLNQQTVLGLLFRQSFRLYWFFVNLPPTSPKSRIFQWTPKILATPSKSWGPFRPFPPLFEKSVRGSTPPPPAEMGGGAHYALVHKQTDNIFLTWKLHEYFFNCNLSKGLYYPCTLEWLFYTAWINPREKSGKLFGK